MAPKSIIIFTQFYPYTYYDSYFAPELFELSKFYSRIFLVSSDLDSDIVKPVPPNTKAYRYLPVLTTSDRFSRLRHLFSVDFMKELFRVIKKVSVKNIVHAVWYALSSLEKSERYQSFLLKLIQEEKIDVSNLTIYNYWMLEHAHAAGTLKRPFPQLRVVVRAHGSDLYFERSPINYLPLKKLIFEMADAIFFISEKGRKYFQSFHEIKSDAFHKLRVSRLGLPAAKSPQLKLPSDKKFFRIVSNAHIQPLKRIDLIAEALSEIKDLQIEWIHFGDIHKRTAQFSLFKNNVNQVLSDSRNITVVFKGGVTIEEIISFYENNFVDLFVNVSTTEGIPVSIMEAFSFGIPAIASAVGGNPEIVNSENGMLVAATVTKAELANAIRNLLQKPIAERESFRVNALNTWKELFNANVNYPKFVEDVLLLSSSAPKQ